MYLGPNLYSIVSSKEEESVYLIYIGYAELPSHWDRVVNRLGEELALRAGGLLGMIPTNGSICYYVYDFNKSTVCGSNEETNEQLIVELHCTFPNLLRSLFCVVETKI